MPKIKKKRQKVGLISQPTLIEDTTRTSPNYFNVTELPDNLSLGKNGFKIRGTQNLAEDTEIEIEVLDTDGERIYHETQQYQEGVSRVVSVYVYEETPPGEATITLLGEASNRVTGNQEIPDRWEGTRNLKWTRKINVDPNTYNTSMIRFGRTPEVSTETETYVRKEGVFETESASFERLGDPEFEPEPAEGAGDFSTWPLYTVTPGEGRETIYMEYFPPHFGHDYTVIEATNFDWLQVMEDQRLIISEEVLPLDLNMRLRLDRIINKDYARFSILTEEYANFLQEFTIETDKIFLIYEREPLEHETKDRAYYKNLQISFFGTFTGQVGELRIFNKLRGEQEDFEYVARFPVQPRELIVRSNEDRVELVDEAGDFGEQKNRDQFLESSDYNLSAGGNRLLRSVQADPIPRSQLNSSINFIPNNYEFTFNLGNQDLRQFRFFEYAEYTLSFEALLTTKQPDLGELNVYLKGGAFATDRKLIYSKNYIDRTYMEVNPRINFFTNRTADSYAVDTDDDGNEFIKQTDPEPFKIVFQAADMPQEHTLNVSDVSLVPAQEAGFSPDYTILRVPIDTTDYGQNEIERLKYRVDLYDVDNNKAGIQLESR